MQVKRSTKFLRLELLPSVMFAGSMDEIANELVEDLKLATVNLIGIQPRTVVRYSICSDSPAFCRWRSQDWHFLTASKETILSQSETGHTQQLQRPSDF